jgi:hypothetical protein
MNDVFDRHKWSPGSCNLYGRIRLVRVSSGRHANKTVHDGIGRCQESHTHHILKLKIFDPYTFVQQKMELAKTTDGPPTSVVVTGSIRWHHTVFLLQFL